ncbi:oxygen-independent coproporphyrinogen III oxidase [Arenicella sp. 4NH20-0111]|uniref:oxygen-independent coproporphyrinogen III oxidase n=1 Tax=Arenicella sp. 4NH20-0111 TaxID=3127648 RepID=UPI00310937D7
MNTIAELPKNLIEKYDIQVPRYTSYPTAIQFTNQFDSQEYERHSLTSNSSLLPKDLSIYVHVPFCESLCYFCGCNKVITQPNNKKVDAYLERLLHEIALRSQLYSDDRLVTQIHFGGGTPNFLTVDQIRTVLDQIAWQFHLDLPSNLEISIELDPRSTSPDELNLLSLIGINRFSIGVQDFSKNVQKAINREQDETATLDIIDAALKYGQSVNVDLITGLPLQDVDSFETTLSKIIDSGVTRVAAYNFAYLPERIKAQRMIKASSLPSTETRLALSSLVRNRLISAGYVHIGMDHYALPNDPLAIARKENTLQRNFQGYTTHRETDLIGVGVSAISKLDTAFCQNESTLSLYNEMVDSGRIPVSRGVELDFDDQIRSEVIQQIMCRESVDLSATTSQFTQTNHGVSLSDYFSNELIDLKKYEVDGLIKLHPGGFRITEAGRYFMRPIASVFDRYLGASSKDGVLPFSRNL